MSNLHIARHFTDYHRLQVFGAKFRLFFFARLLLYILDHYDWYCIEYMYLRIETPASTILDRPSRSPTFLATLSWVRSYEHSPTYHPSLLYESTTPASSFYIPDTPEKSADRSTRSRRAPVFSLGRSTQGGIHAKQG